MVEVAEELVEAVVAGQVLVTIPQVVLAELAGGVAVGLEGLGYGDITGLQADRHAGHAHLGQTGSQYGLARDEGRASRRAAVLRVIVGEHHAFLGDAVDVGSLITDDPLAIGADVGLANVVTEDHQDVGFVCRHGGRGPQGRRYGQCQPGHPFSCKCHSCFSVSRYSPCPRRRVPESR
ncbi:hypothetical protein D3C79_877100 [compost metagenome]